MIVIVGLNLLFLFIGAAILATLSEDYFLDSAPHRSPAIKLLRNTAGVLVSAVGLAMLLLPGPGLIMLLAGLVLIENQRKTRLLEHLISRPSVYDGVRSLRRRFNRPMFQLSADTEKRLKLNRQRQQPSSIRWRRQGKKPLAEPSSKPQK